MLNTIDFFDQWAWGKVNRNYLPEVQIDWKNWTKPQKPMGYHQLAYKSAWSPKRGGEIKGGWKYIRINNGKNVLKWWKTVTSISEKHSESQSG